MVSNAKPSLAWTVSDVAEYFGVSRPTVYRWMDRDDNPLPFHQPGGSGFRRFDPAEVEEWGKQSSSRGDANVEAPQEEEEEST